MADASDRRLLESFEGSLETVVARGKEEAASTLAQSLLQGRSLADIAGREDAWELRFGEGRRLPVTLIGRDFIGAGTPTSVLVPSARAVLIQTASGTLPQRSDATLTEELRGLAGVGAPIRVDTECGSFSGLLARVGPDHLLLVQAKMGEVLVGLAGISALELIRQQDAL